MKVMILCGGMGTRLREETEYRPKPLVEVGGRPILWHIMKLYAHHGYRDFALCLGYRGQMIKDYFLNYGVFNTDFTIHLGQERKIEHHGEHDEQEFRVTMADTGLDAMTGGRIKRAGRYLDDDDIFMVTYGDGLANVDITKLVEFHRSHGRLATITVAKPTERFGAVNIGQSDRVEKFREKPVGDGWINAGFMVLDRRVLEYIDGPDCVLEQGPLERLTAEGELAAFRHDDFFYCIDTYREYLAINEMCRLGNTPWKVWE